MVCVYIRNNPDCQWIVQDEEEGVQRDDECHD